MNCCAGGARSAMEPLDHEQAERLLLWAYTALPLVPAADDGSRGGILAPVGRFEVRLTEFPPDRMPFLPLWIELLERETRETIESRGFSDVDDAGEAVRELVSEARRKESSEAAD